MMATLPDFDTMYEAFLRKDSSFDGIFFVAVKTTGIFCRPTCPARKPKRENVEFLRTSREALQRGYRPCKICRPLAFRGEIPDWLMPLLTEVEATPGIRLKDVDLRRRGLDPNRVRRWFRRHHGMTFQGYLRALRIGQAFGRIRHGDKVIDAAFESGYESLSGFTESFKKLTWFSPKHSPHQHLMTVTRLLTPLGPMLAGATTDGVCLLEFMDRRMLETQLNRLSRRLQARWVPGDNRHLSELHVQLNEYFTGKRTMFDFPLVLAGTTFQEAVWRELRTIPYGETRSYLEQAERLGRPEAVRAVARANGDNRMAIIIPCHRVIGKDGQLTGYGGGLWRKQHLLDLERKHTRR
ncbi:MAG: bifunctional transcriptional activator/DNA repair protein Ada [Acidobacteria bacterium]|nr:bifunctional transcriptional activator/DNA repair protein Ada [Acidobacteriota bacterium]